MGGAWVPNDGFFFWASNHGLESTVPEPATILLVTIGGAVVLVVCRGGETGAVRGKAPPGGGIRRDANSREVVAPYALPRPPGGVREAGSPSRMTTSEKGGDASPVNGVPHARAKDPKCPCWHSKLAHRPARIMERLPRHPPKSWSSPGMNLAGDHPRSPVDRNSKGATRRSEINATFLQALRVVQNAWP